MKSTKLHLFLALAAAASSVSAAIVNETSGIVPGGFLAAANPAAASGGTAATASVNLLVNTFDSTLGSLNSVTYTLTYYSYANYSVSNLSGSSSSYVISWALGYAANSDVNTLTEPGTINTTFNGGLHSIGTGSLANGATVGPVNSGSSQDVYNGTVAGANFANYLGDGITDVTFVFLPTGYSSIGGASNPAGSANPQPTVFYAAQIDVVYDYTPTGVPEASTYAAGAVVLAGAGMVLRRRMVAAKS